MDRPVGERLGERVVDESVLVDERKPVECGARDDDLEVVASSRSVDDCDLRRVRERSAEKPFETIGRHDRIMPAAPGSAQPRQAAVAGWTCAIAVTSACSSSNNENGFWRYATGSSAKALSEGG